MKIDFSTISWNLGGSKHLLIPEPDRSQHRENLNRELLYLLQRHRPHVVSLQEVACCRDQHRATENLVISESFEDYNYHYFPLVNSDRFSFKAKWNRIKSQGGWGQEAHFSQGNAFLIHKELNHIPVWELSESASSRREGGKHFVEQVNLDSGLYFGDRNTEPRAALVAHFVLKQGDSPKPLDIFVVNVHLTTLIMEREGVPQIDAEASRIRMYQLKTILEGIVSRYNLWRRRGFPDYSIDKDRESLIQSRYEPVWVLAGDFNFTPESEEYQLLKRMNFLDLVPHKGGGTKARGLGNPATLTVDYAFAGPKFLSLNPLIVEQEVVNNTVDHTVSVSDHYPLIVRIPIGIPD